MLPGYPVADIGADHGALCCVLVESGWVPCAIAVDVAAGPIARARAAVAAAGLGDRIDVRRGDGLAPLALGEVRTVTICGMGGETMARILARGLPRLVQVQRLVLSPHTAAPELRRQLVSTGWTDVAGGWVHDRGHHYPVAAWERGSAAWTEADYRWGRAARAAPGTGLLTYLHAEQSRMAVAHGQALEGRGEADQVVRALQERMDQLSEELSRLR